jgi:hypothetical protein
MSLRERIENAYSGWFVPQLGIGLEQGAGRGMDFCHLEDRDGSINRSFLTGMSLRILRPGSAGCLS